jgi:diadenosine tetraphosphate (Ap4A) HIT family hydrolase
MGSPEAAPETSRREVWRDFFALDDGRVLHADESVVVFMDRTPKATTHLLVVPRYEAIRGVESLRPQHVPLLSHMRDVGVKACAELQQRSGRATEASALVLGFHRKPLRSVDHLHLHVMQPPFTPGWQRLRYREPPKPLAIAFIQFSSVIARLRSVRPC